MNPAAIEIRLILSARGEPWAYAVEVRGRLIAASDGDEAFPTPGAALQAAVAEVVGNLPSRKGAGNGDE